MLEPDQSQVTPLVHEPATVSVSPLAFVLAAINAALAWLMLAGIGFYRRFISPLIGPPCRFTPTCSAYRLEAIQRPGPWKGGWLPVKRLLRCHPLPPRRRAPLPG